MPKSVPLLRGSGPQLPRSVSFARRPRPHEPFALRRFLVQGDPDGVDDELGMHPVAHASVSPYPCRKLSEAFGMVVGVAEEPLDRSTRTHERAAEQGRTLEQVDAAQPPRIATPVPQSLPRML